MNDLSKRILELAAKYKDYTAQNLSKLVQIKSLSMQEKDVQHELKRQMEEAGFDEVRFDGLGNVIGRIGNGKKSLLLMLTWILLIWENLLIGILTHFREK